MKRWGEPVFDRGFQVASSATYTLYIDYFFNYFLTSHAIKSYKCSIKARGLFDGFLKAAAAIPAWLPAFIRNNNC